MASSIDDQQNEFFEIDPNIIFA
ncbi:uncharacterized protein METZ01_LOCUS516884 [marine metagenome]|uniref:Uncharacterized protein n=1 Tax=marine metagenome TaxID=408172 RepID=A0A383F5X1_9ZZZZ